MLETVNTKHLTGSRRVSKGSRNLKRARTRLADVPGAKLRLPAQEMVEQRGGMPANEAHFPRHIAVNHSHHVRQQTLEEPELRAYVAQAVTDPHNRRHSHQTLVRDLSKSGIRRLIRAQGPGETPCDRELVAVRSACCGSRTVK